MYISCSLLASVVFLSFSTSTQARVAQKKLDTENSGELKAKKADINGLHGLPVKNIFAKRQDPPECPPDFYTNILNDAAESDVQIFCNRWLALGPATVTSTTSPLTTIVATGRTNQTMTATKYVTVLESSSESVASRRAILPRAVNIAARVQAVNAIINSVLATETTTGSIPINTNRVADEKGLTHACECMVKWGKADPTATETTVSTVPVRYTMVGENSGALLTVTSTVTSTILESSNSTGSASMGASITAPPSMSFVSSGSIAPTTAFTASPVVGPRVPTVIGIPFSCPAANATEPRYIVGNVQYAYAVYCDKAIKSSESDHVLDTIPGIQNATSCAEYCSLMNHAVNGTACGATQFTPESDNGGSCTLYAPLPDEPTDNITDEAGSVAIILKGSSAANGQDCLVSGSTQSIVSAAPSDLLSSITAAGHSLSIPGLVTRSQTGGASQTYYSTGSTDSKGFYYYTWYSLYQSSSEWWEVYAATWSSCSQVPVTITRQLPASVSSGIVVTTIISSGITTVISGNLTSIYVAGGGTVPATDVVASTTSGGVVVSTGFSTAFATTLIGSGVEVSVPTSTVNSTSLTTVSGATATTISEGGSGVIPPSTTPLPVSNSTVVASGSEGFTASGSSSTSNSTATGGESGLSTTSTVAEVTISSQTSTGTSIGGSGVVPPAPTNGTVVATTSTGDFENTDGLRTGGRKTPSAPSGQVSSAPNSTALVVTSVSSQITESGTTFISSGDTFVSLSIGGSGSQGPIIATSNSTALLPTAPYETLSATSGDSSSSRKSVGGGYDYTPLPVSSSVILSTAVSVEVPVATLNVSVPAGTGVFSTGGLTSVLLSTGSGGVIPPASTNASETTTTVVTVDIPIATTVSVPAATVIFSTGGLTSILLSTGSGGIIPPSPTNASETVSTLTVNTTSSLSTTVVVTVPVSASASPIVSSNITLPLGTASVVFSSSSSTGVILSTGGGGVIPPSSTGTAPASLTPIPTSNATLPSSPGVDFSNSDNPRTGGRHSSSTPISSGTAPVVSGTPLLSSNVTIPGSTGYVSSTETPVVPVSSNSAPYVPGTAPVSALPSSSSNATLPTPTSGFSNTDNPRVPGNRTRTSSSPYAPGTAPVLISSEASVIPSFSSNATISTPTDVFSNTDNPRVPGNRTSVPYGTVPLVSSTAASVTASPSLNGTIPSTPTGTFTNSDDLRTGGRHSSSTPISSGTAPLASGTPSLSFNATIPGSSGFVSSTETPIVPVNSTSASYAPGTVSSVIVSSEASITPSLSSNITIVPTSGTGYSTASLVLTTAPSVTASPSLNATISSTATDEFSYTDNPRTGGRHNSTTPIGTGTAPASVISSTAYPVFNTTAPINTGTGTAPASVISSTAYPVFNTTSPVGTGYGTVSLVLSTAPSVTASPSLNSTISTLTGEFSNIDNPRTGGRHNSTTPIGTGTAPASVISSTAFPVFNSTAPINTGTGTAPASVISSTGYPVFNSTPAVGTGTAPVSAISSTAYPIFNTTAPINTGTAPPVLNITSLPGTSTKSRPYGGYGPPPEQTTTSGDFNQTEGDRFGRSRTRLGTAVGSSAGPIASANTTLVGTGTASVFIPIPSLNSSAPVGTASVPLTTGVSASPTAVANSTVPLVTGGTAVSVSVSVSSTVVNATVPLVTGGTGTAVSASPTVVVNATVPLVTGGTAVSASPIVVNATIPLITGGTGTAVSASPTVVVNATIPLVTGGTVSSSAIAVTGTSGLPIISSNSSAFLPTGTVSSFPLAPPANITSAFETYSLVRGTSGFPTPLTNVTIPATLVSSPSASATPIVSSNGTTEACLATPETRIIPRTYTITTVYYETVVGSSTCQPTASGGVPFPTSNGTLPVGTSPVSAELPVGTAPSSVTIIVSPIPVSSRHLDLPGTAGYRRSGETATQEQINNACNLASNLILNPNFAIGESDDGALGWNVSPSPAEDPTVRFSLNTTDNGTIASVQTARTAHSITVSQPLTLCPGMRYKLTSIDRAANTLSKCTTEYLIGKDTVYTVTPGEVASTRDGYYTAGSTPSDVSQDLQVRSSCEGESGANLGADPADWRGVEFSDLQLVPVPS